MLAQADESTWPSHLRPGAIRFARASRHYDTTIAFYREPVGLPVVGEFTASLGADGTIFGLPDALQSFRLPELTSKTGVVERVCSGP